MGELLQKYVDACIATRQLRAEGPKIEEITEEDPGPTGEEVLSAMESGDSERAVEVAKIASTTAINYTDEVSRNALLLAASEGHLEAVHILLKRNDFRGVNARNSIGSTALHQAAANGEPEVCQAILSCSRFNLGVNVQNNNGQTPLDFSVEFGEGDAAEVLRAAGATTSGRAMRSRERAGGDLACRLRAHAQGGAADENGGSDM